MTKLERLFNIAQIENIQIHYFDLSSIGLLGLNVEKENCPNMILLDISIKNNPSKLLEVLAEEIGHYYTTSGNFINSDRSYRNRLRINKCENKAMRWACEFLITESELIYHINTGVSSAYDLADNLEVSVDILIKRLEYLSKQKQMIDLGNDRYLVLTNLPNFYIYTKI